ncbi:MAG: hypothetical protein KGK08_03310 [Acidobacteriota bacterium]|nr:hypothetical protein [Acidobacteriota bacterium]
MQQPGSVSAPPEWVVCPACHGPLTAAGADVRCVGCGRIYPVVDGLPVLLESRSAS